MRAESTTPDRPLPRHLLTVLVCALAVVAGCRGGSTAPTPVPPGGASPLVSGKTIDALTGLPIGGARLVFDGGGDVLAQADGTFTFAGPQTSLSQLVGVVASSSQSVERRTFLRAPGPDAQLSLIPSSFDLTSFNQMFRGDGVLRRWVATPALVVERRVLTFTSIVANDYVATDAVLGDDVVQETIGDLEWALPQLTGGRFGAFAGREVTLAQPGVSVVVNRPMTIVVAHYEGLQAATDFVGYSRWFWNGASEMVGGIIMIDNAFARRASAAGRRSLRAHELGHALGWRHVEGRPSVMNPAAGTVPTDNDRAGALLAFQRPPLNRAPDIDSSPSSVNRRDVDRVFWHADH